MKERPDLNLLSKEIFEANKDKGFHDKEISNETLLMLVITELSEAIEADRKRKRADLSQYKSAIHNSNFYAFAKDEWYNTWFSYMFGNNIKDTIEDELADAIIRLLDLAGLRCIKLDILVDSDSIECIKEETFPETIYQICRLLFRQGVCNPDNEDVKYIIVDTITEIEALSQYLSIDLWLHVELKLKYNQSRPTKHGKSY